MADTTALLATALENEGSLLLKLISELQNEDLFDFARRLAELNPKAGAVQLMRSSMLRTISRTSRLRWRTSTLSDPCTAPTQW